MIPHISGNRSNVYGLGEGRFLPWQGYNFSSCLLLINGFACASDQSSLPYANINNTWNYTSTFFILSYYTINTYIQPDVGKQE